jgi:hypothetical protein
MPNYNPKDMAMMLQMSKKGAMTPQEMALMQNINTAMQPEMAAGNVGMMPPQVMQSQAMPQGQAQGQPMNRLAQIQAAANQVLAGGENPEGQRMANVARYFQGR